MKLCSYVVRMDYGFAPNPFEGYCTLATCKYRLRRAANIGDWIVGTGSKENLGNSRLIYAMKVTEKIHYKEYWNDPRFQRKKPDMNGSIKNKMGDNIYELIKESEEDINSWKQHDSHHSNIDGSEFEENKRKDLNCKYVLVSSEFYYFGENAPEIEKRFLSNPSIIQIRNYKCDFPKNFVDDFIEWVKEIAKDEELGVEKGLLGFPSQFGDISRLVNKG